MDEIFEWERFWRCKESRIFLKGIGRERGFEREMWKVLKMKEVRSWLNWGKGCWFDMVRWWDFMNLDMWKHLEWNYGKIIIHRFYIIRLLFYQSMYYSSFIIEPSKYLISLLNHYNWMNGSSTFPNCLIFAILLGYRVEQQTSAPDSTILINTLPTPVIITYVSTHSLNSMYGFWNFNL